MFEPTFLGQVRLKGVGQSQPSPASPAPSPASSDARFSVPAADQNFTPLSLAPFVVPFVSGWAYPPQYPPENFDCVLNEDGLSWTCTPKAAYRFPVVGPRYPLVPMGPIY